MGKKKKNKNKIGTNYEEEARGRCALQKPV